MDGKMAKYSPHIYILGQHESALCDACQWEHEEIFNKRIILVRN